LINKHEGSVTELVEEGEEVEANTGERLLAAYKRLLPAVSTVIISGSKAAGFSGSLVSEMVHQAKDRSLRVILDIRGKDLIESLPWKPDVIKPNLFEFALTYAPDLVAGNEVNYNIMSESAIKTRIEVICRGIFEKYQCNIVLSRGSKAIWYAENGELAEFEIDPVKPVNTIGSGDAFTAGFAAALEEGRSFREAVAEGARCGKLNAMLLRPGVIH
jgi:1-phosphofructokinase/tagatose 6-phosphate kinase